MDRAIQLQKEAIKPLRVLVGCEYSGRVRQAWRERGHDAYSCDLLPSEDNSPYHLQGDVLQYLDDGWDVGIFHPVCTYNNLAGIRWMYHPDDSLLPPEQRRRHPQYPNRMDDFMRETEFFMKLKNCKIPKTCIENSQPHGLAMSVVGKYTQKVQPWMFGDPFTKGACLWLKNLPKLVATEIVPKELRKAECHMASPGPNRWKERSRTYPGPANAMAEQWGGTVCQ